MSISWMLSHIVLANLQRTLRIGTQQFERFIKFFWSTGHSSVR